MLAGPPRSLPPAGLTVVMALTFFPIAYIMLMGMMRALDPSLDEAAANLGASKWRTFRKVSLPLLAPGIASAFLLLFVEALADLGNPLVLGGNYTVLASRMYIAIVGEYNLTAGSVLGGHAAGASALRVLRPSLLLQQGLDRVGLGQTLRSSLGDPQPAHPLAAALHGAGARSA